MSPSISVIIPAYNVENWLGRAVGSLVDQTFEDFEVLIVDDGSTDSTGVVADGLAEADARVRVIHQENSGAAQARNNAMEQARGAYLYFMDGDDVCERDMLADMHAFAEDHDLDLVVTGFYIDTFYREGKAFTEKRNAPNVVFSSRQEFREGARALFDEQLLYAPWNKLYRRSYLMDRHIRFPQTFWDDLPFNLEVVRDIERVGSMDGHYYHFFRARAESENTKYRPDMYAKREEENAWMRDLYEHWGIDGPEVDEFLSRRYAERLLGCVENVTCADCSLTRTERRAKIAEMISTPEARHALQTARPRTRMMRVVLAPLKAGNVDLTMWTGSFISFVKRNSTNAFARLKANR